MNFIEKLLNKHCLVAGDSTPVGRALTKACLLNLASCALKLQQHANAEQYCDDVLAGEPSNVKALYRRGQASYPHKTHTLLAADVAAALRQEKSCGVCDGEMSVCMAFVTQHH